MNHFDERARTYDAEPGHRDRRDNVLAAIREAVPMGASTRVLEYGSGTGTLGLALAPDVAAVLLADASAGMTEVATERIVELGLDHVRAVQLDVLTDALPDGRFDVIISVMALHHVPDVPAALRAFAALLDEGGRVALCDLDAEDGSFHTSDFGGHHGFARAALAADLTAAGFEKPAFSTPHHEVKEHEDGVRHYPLFLAVAQKRDASTAQH